MNLVQQIEFGNLVWEIDTKCYIYQPDQKLLVVADLHLGKGNHFAQLGYPIPLYDFTDTIDRLSLLINYFRPYTVILLGDSFHSSISIKFLSNSLLHKLKCLTRQTENFIWLTGNHDSTLLGHEGLEGIFLSSFTIGDIVLAHIPTVTDAYQIVGHYHPKIKVKIRGKVLKGKCYVKSEKLLIMPSFGSYTGGLYISEPAIQKLVSLSSPSYYFIHEQGVFRI